MENYKLNDRLWYVLYTMPKSEKKVVDLLQRRGVKTFLPLYQKVVQWSDRKKKIMTPLFSCYVFAQLNRIELSMVYGVAGFVRFVATDGIKDIVPESDIENIKRLLTSNPEATNEEFIEGDEVLIKEGPLSGLTGRLVNKKGKRKLVVYFKSISYGIQVEVSPGSAERIAFADAV